MTPQRLVARKEAIVSWLKTPLDEGYEPAARRARRLGRWGFPAVYMVLLVVAELFDPMPALLHTLLLASSSMLFTIFGLLFLAAWFEPGCDLSTPLSGVAHKPPRFPKFLLLLVPRRNREHLLGDLEEEYSTLVVPEYGRRLADVWYWWHSLISLGWFIYDRLKYVTGFVLLWRSRR
jgi:hypothetical protein